MKQTHSFPSAGHGSGTVACASSSYKALRIRPCVFSKMSLRSSEATRGASRRLASFSPTGTRFEIEGGRAAAPGITASV